MAKKPLRITLAQLNYRICDFARNLGRITDAVQSAAAADLIVFSELCLSGYSPQDRVEEPEFLARQDAALAAVCALSKSTRAALVIGAVSVNAGVGKPPPATSRASASCWCRTGGSGCAITNNCCPPTTSSTSGVTSSPAQRTPQFSNWPVTALAF